MIKFEFSDNRLSIDIKNNTYICDPAAAEAEIGRAEKDIADFNKILSAGGAGEFEIKSAAESIAAHIENILGDGALGKIFENRSVSFHDVCDILIYIKGCTMDFERKKSRLYTQYMSSGNKERPGTEK